MGPCKLTIPFVSGTETPGLFGLPLNPVSLKKNESL